MLVDVPIYELEQGKAPLNIKTTKDASCRIDELTTQIARVDANRRCFPPLDKGKAPLL
jgi:hypothetical protein